MGNYIKKLYCSFLQAKVDKINKVKNRKTNTKMNLIKAYFIIAVICAHTGGGGIVFPMDNWVSPIFIFMPIFVFVSGFFYNAKSDNTNCFAFIKSKISTLVLPYFLWNFIYGIINTVARKYDIIDYGDNLSWHSLFVRPWVDGHQFHFNIPAWFLLTLFIDVMVIFALRKSLNKLHILNDFALLTFTFVISVISIIFAQKGYNYGFYLVLTKAGFMLPYFQLGYVYKKHEKVFNANNGRLIIILAVVLSVCLFLNGENGLEALVVFARFTGNPLLITAITTISILLVACIFEMFAPVFENNKLVYAIGNNTFAIMMHHGFIVFIINFGLFILNKFINISSFNIENFKNTLWYAFPGEVSKIRIIYLLLGVAVPVLSKFIYDKFIMYLHAKIKY